MLVSILSIFWILGEKCEKNVLLGIPVQDIKHFWMHIYAFVFWLYCFCFANSYNTMTNALILTNHISSLCIYATPPLLLHCFSDYQEQCHYACTEPLITPPCSEYGSLTAGQCEGQGRVVLHFLP